MAWFLICSTNATCRLHAAQWHAPQVLWLAGRGVTRCIDGLLLAPKQLKEAEEDFCPSLTALERIQRSLARRHRAILNVLAPGAPIINAARMDHYALHPHRSRRTKCSCIAIRRHNSGVRQLASSVAASFSVYLHI